MLKKVASYIIILLLVISIFLTLILNVINSQLLDKDMMLKRLGNVNYYSKAYEIVLSDMKGILEPSGFSENILKDTFTVISVRQEVENIVNSIYNNKEYEINTQEFEKKVMENINQELSQNLRELNTTEKKAVDEFVLKLGDIFEEEIFPHKYISFIKEYMPKIINLINKAILLTYVVDLILFAILIFINIKNGIVAFKYTCICVISSGIVMFIPSILVNLTLKVQNISIINVNVSVLLQQIIIDILNNLQTIGTIFTIVGIILLFITNYFITKNSKKV